MKLGEIKLEALRIMNINNDGVLLVEKLGNLATEKRYGKYLNNMFNCINKAIDVINYRKVLPQERAELKDYLVSSGGINNRFDVSTIKNFLSCDRIVYEDNKGNYCQRVPFDKEGKTIVVSNEYNPEFLALVFNTKIENITEDLSDTEEIPNLPDEFARLIPYYIKFELYQEDEPDLALNAKSTFEQGIESLRVYEDEQESFEITSEFSSGVWY